MPVAAAVLCPRLGKRRLGSFLLRLPRESAPVQGLLCFKNVLQGFHNFALLPGRPRAMLNIEWPCYALQFCCELRKGVGRHLSL